MGNNELKLADMAYCPCCGGGLTLVKCRSETVVFKTCPQNHLWEIWRSSMGFQFYSVAVVKCGCGDTLPLRDAREVEGRRLCPKCFEETRKVWRMDKEKSYARLEITPIETSEGLYYDLHTSIEIKPYPNPFMFGGMWGGGAAKSEQELEQAIKGFEQTVSKLKENGMEKVEIVRHDKRVRTQQMGLSAAVVEHSKVKEEQQMQFERQFLLLENLP